MFHSSASDLSVNYLEYQDEYKDYNHRLNNSIIKSMTTTKTFSQKILLST